MEEAAAWLRERAVPRAASPGVKPEYAFRISEGGLDVEAFQGWFDKDRQGPAYLGNAARFFVEYARAGELSAYAGGFIETNMYNARNYALMKLRMSGELEGELSDVVEEAFGDPLVLDRLSTQTRLRVGRVDVEVPLLNRPTAEYADAVAGLPLLDDQGDGLRSFVGVVGQVLTHQIDVFLIDEPEAFLHPGQARVLGRWLADVATNRNMQVVVATHDRDFLLGLLSNVGETSVTILRVSRAGRESHFTQVPASDISDVFARPVLRYSNVLQGLFHNQVVVCEGDADCRFYGAALDASAARAGKRPIADDTLFVPSAGKGQISSLVAVLAKLGVRAWTVPDFDVLRSRDELKAIVMAVGGVWSKAIDADYVTLTRAINAGGLWDAVKAGGVSSVPAGDATLACNRLLDALAAIGILVVPVGEMEGFYRASGEHGSSWVSEAPAADAHASQTVTEFLAPLLG